MNVEVRLNWQEEGRGLTWREIRRNFQAANAVLVLWKVGFEKIFGAEG
jgi:hypothetical protein